jgi:hypothetical protein
MEVWKFSQREQLVKKYFFYTKQKSFFVRASDLRPVLTSITKPEFSSSDQNVSHTGPLQVVNL